ncbi:UpxY family transcription antiterminator [Alloacidobacterium dinghuense]|uniref:UpxY family transcription antiterminator n=1 Tax=Alloacidobacterium dinghuense TaxID=2763107 RepID=A0A7G8BLQ4_9BACT|nr:UpxY family transcription antiterminator [Alloacidobacterium dinghuense]QNI33474.1 UpxY family transcription antiterminator [Alloacidobacterium dinghuense]
MSTSNQVWESLNTTANVGNDVENWYGVQTRARHEKVVASRLCEKGVTTFFPTVTEVHRWSDRKKLVELPLFSCYLFVKLAPCNEDRQKVLRIDSVLSLVGPDRTGTPIPSEQIEAVRILVKKKLSYTCHPYLKIGQRVRVRSGALDGMEGILQSRKGDSKLIISVDAMQRSLAIQIDGYDIEPI